MPESFMTIEQGDQVIAFLSTQTQLLFLFGVLYFATILSLITFYVLREVSNGLN